MTLNVGDLTVVMDMIDRDRQTCLQVGQDGSCVVVRDPVSFIVAHTALRPLPFPVRLHKGVSMFSLLCIGKYF